MAADLIELPAATVQDIPGVLRAIADQIEVGEYGRVSALALVMEGVDGSIRTFGAGAADYYRAYALFHLGLDNLLEKREGFHL